MKFLSSLTRSETFFCEQPKTWIGVSLCEFRKLSRTRAKPEVNQYERNLDLLVY